MSIHIEERRHSVRMSAAHQAVIYDRRRKPIARGRTANISERGIFVLTRSNHAIAEDQAVFVELIVPEDPCAGTLRQVAYRCRVIRRQELGNMLGIGLELQEKIA